MQKMLFLYLKTGGGHISCARVIKQAIEERYGSQVEIELYNGFSRHQVFANLFFEVGYRITSSVLPGAYSLAYDWSQHPAWMKFYRYLGCKRTARELRKYVLKNHITKIISFHFGLSPAAVAVVESIKREIPFLTVVTDIFTAHPSWFMEKKYPYVVFSRKLQEAMVNEQGIAEHLITVMPFILNKKFLLPVSPEEIITFKKKHGLPLNKKIVLLAGGGEGLPNALAIVSECIKRKTNFSLAVVCGRDLATKKMLEALALVNPKLSIKVFGFVPFMDELVKLCDCAVIKAGPATLLEVLKSGKPVIICKYIHGQELGNVRFAVENRVGWFIQSPKAIVTKVNTLFSNPDYQQEVSAKVSQLPLETDITPLAEYIYNL